MSSSSSSDPDTLPHSAASMRASASNTAASSSTSRAKMIIPPHRRESASTVSDRLHSILTTTAPPALHASNSEPFPTRASIFADSSSSSHYPHHLHLQPSRSMSLALSASSCGGTGSSERGMVGMARRPNDPSSRNVAVVGKTYLKILKVPLARTSASSPSAASLGDLSSNPSLATRRSRTRNSMLGAGNGGKGDAEEVQVVEEIMDVRSGARLGPAYLFSDVKWGYGATSNKLATSLSNGAVVLWDLEQDGPSKVDQLKYEHDRAVNSIIFGGASGSWLMSGGQDGLLKLWDIREAKPASLILKASSPVLQLSFSPSAAQPFSLLAVCASGTMIRYDIRYTGRGGGGATDRIAGHVGACLAMDWRDSLDSDHVSRIGEEPAERKEGGYVATGGMDGTIKIWDFSLPSLSVKPVRTLRMGRPVKDVKWHSGGQKLAACSLPSLSLGRPGAEELGEYDGIDEASVGARLGARLERKSSYEQAGTGLNGSEWRNEVEIWDIARESFPTRCIRTLQPTSAVLFNDDDTIWSTSSASATFRQHDLTTDTYVLMDTFPRSAASWNSQGEMAFVEEPSRKDDRYAEPLAITGPAFRPDTSIATVSHFDPDHDHSTFEMLANNYVCGGKEFGELCEINAEVARNAHRPDAAELWSILKLWLDDDDAPFSQATTQDSSPAQAKSSLLPRPSPPSSTTPLSSRPISPLRLDDLVLHSSPALPSLSIPLRTVSSRTRRSYSNPLSQTRSLTLSPLVTPIEQSHSSLSSSDSFMIPPAFLLAASSSTSSAAAATASGSSGNASSSPSASIAGLDFARNPSTLSRKPFAPLLPRKSSPTRAKEKARVAKSGEAWSDSDSEREGAASLLLPSTGGATAIGRLMPATIYRAPGSVASHSPRTTASFASPLPSTTTLAATSSKPHRLTNNQILLSSASSADSATDSAEDEDDLEVDDGDDVYADEGDGEEREGEDGGEGEEIESNERGGDGATGATAATDPHIGIEGGVARRFSGSSRFKSLARRRSTFSHSRAPIQLHDHALSMPTTPFSSESILYPTYNGNGNIRPVSVSSQHHHHHHSKSRTISLTNEIGAMSIINSFASSPSGLGLERLRRVQRPSVSDGNSRSRSMSLATVGATRLAAQAREKDMADAAVQQEVIEERRMRAAETKKMRALVRIEELRRVEEMREGVRLQVKKTLEAYAELGDHQLCAVVCCVLQNKSMDFHPMFVARLSKAYLDLLRRSELYSASAGLIKYCTTEVFRAQAQQNIVFHTSCSCGKAIEQPPYDFCRRCNTSSTTCIICHLTIRSLLTLCTKCNHVAHPSCLSAYAASLAPLPLTASTIDPHSYPSTPGFMAPTIRAWMWGEEQESAAKTMKMDPGNVGEREGERGEGHALNCCPKGECDCRGCSLAFSKQ